jgi:hypothetical protein
MADNSAETDTLPQWDLSNVYPGLDSEPFEQALADLRAQLDGLDRYLADHDVKRAAAALPADRLVVVIAGYLERLNAAQRLYLSLRFFSWAFVTTDSYDALAKRRYSELEMLGARLEQGGMRFQGCLGGQADELPAAIGSADISFYNFPYAFGLLFGLGLYAIYRERGDAFIPEYESLLASTGEGTAADLAARFGIDLRLPEFWQGRLKVLERQVDQYLAL